MSLKMGNLLPKTAFIFTITFGGAANAEGVLNIFTWGNITPPEMIRQFEEEYNVSVTITDYDSNDAALARVRQGGHGFDIVVPTSSYVPIWINEGLLLETRPDQMENFQNIDEQWRDPPYDPGSRYSVPFFIGTTGTIVNTSVYSGDINTSAIFLDPPEELVGRINVPPTMDEILHLAIAYVGGEPCTTDREILRQVRDKLVEAKPKWASMIYGPIELIAQGDIAGGAYWSGASYRVRDLNSDYAYGYPKEGYPIWLDNVAVLSDAQNVENAKLYQNFVMRPEIAAMVSEFTRYPSAVAGAMELLPEEMQHAPEISIPAKSQEHASWLQACPDEANELYTQIWTALQR